MCEPYNNDTENLRSTILNDIYAGAAAGMGAMLLDEGRVIGADERQLHEIAKQYGYEI